MYQLRSIATSRSCPTSQHNSLDLKKLRKAATTVGFPCCVRPCGVIRGLRARVRDDVNWDAFRPDLGSSSAALAVTKNTRHMLSRVPERRCVQQVDFLVIGSGIAGLSYALKVAEYGTVAVITKDFANEGCTQYAQGGVCAVLDRHDSVAEHVRDTMIAGAFLNDVKAVEVVCREGPARVLELIQLGAEFTVNGDGSLHLTKEGGHSQRRVVHAADMTGREIERALLSAARAHSSITFFEHHLAVDLVVDEYLGIKHCFGADVLDQRAMTMTRFVAQTTMLACGGAGQLFPNTTNPHVATGDGIAMAYRASAAISNLEFVQFHPTALYDPTNTGRTFLITEAVRGEGGLLFNKSGERFMEKYDAERLELAPRDIVARSIHHELLKRGESHVWLDISHKPSDEIMHHFPNIAKKCLELGVDIARDPIPVVPAQHYTCGGVQTGLLGETTVQGLYACGEVTCSGLHGANRLASNSLLEGLVFADRAAGPSVAHAEYVLRNCGRQLHYAAASANFTGSSRAALPAAPVAAWAASRRTELREAMWNGCGIVRTVRGMREVRTMTASVASEAALALKTHGVCTELVELYNLALVADMTVSCALQRQESRGGHYCLDYPVEREAERRASVVCLPEEEREWCVSRKQLSAGKPSGSKALFTAATVNGAALDASAVMRKLSSSSSAKKKTSREMVMRSLPEAAT